MLVAASLPLTQRWREETQDRRVTLAVDWDEYREFNARLGLSAGQLLKGLRQVGATGVVLSPATLKELFDQRRVIAVAPGPNGPFDTARIHFPDAVLGHAVFAYWSLRQVQSVSLVVNGRAIDITLKKGKFNGLQDIEAGFDPGLIDTVQTAGLQPILRLNNDAWLKREDSISALSALPIESARTAVLFGIDALPQDSVQKRALMSWLRRHQVVQFLAEFKPALGAKQVAFAAPELTYRAHSIPSAELKEMKRGPQMARWSRALNERSCRLLLVRLAPQDTLESFHAVLADLGKMLKRQGLLPGLGWPRYSWQPPSFFQRNIAPWLAFLIVTLAPLLSLAWAKATLNSWPQNFFRIIFGCLCGALVAAAVADSPLTRIEVVPFRGVKWSFLASWLIAGLVIYDWDELRTLLSAVVLRKDLVIGAGVLAVVAYLMIRSGNAPASMKPAGEQSLRDFLESALLARPRFKEFALGIPALWMGCYIVSRRSGALSRWDARPWIWAGLVGPISMINTFCHLHSPITLAFKRSLVGWVLGIMLGTIWILAASWVGMWRSAKYGSGSGA
jgi:hypothetical protein